MIPTRLLAISLCVTSLAGAAAEGQDIPRTVRWRDDLDYLVQRLEITHPNLYANISAQAFHEYADQLKGRIPTATDLEMAYGVQELVARLRSLHTLVNPLLFQADNPTLAGQLQFYPVLYYPFDDGLYVLRTAEHYKAILGKKVLRIGKLPTEEVMRQLARFIAADNDMTTLANLPRFFLNDGQLLRIVGASDSADHLTLRLENDDGTAFDSEIRADPNYLTGAIQWLSMDDMAGNPPPLYKRPSDSNYWFQYLPEQRAVYVHIKMMNDMPTEPFSDFSRRLLDTVDDNKAEKLIIDVRNCPGGDHIELPLLKGILARPYLDRPDRLFLIIGRLTASAAEHLTAEFQRYTKVTLFGEPTSSKPNQYGAMERFTLPHSKLQIACASKYFQDAEPSDYSVATAPDIYVPRRAHDFKENRDPVMERIFSYDSYKGLRQDFLGAMTDAYAAGGIEGFKRKYGSLRGPCREHGFNMETLLYRDLDPWMAENRKSDKDYFEYLKFIHGELPDSLPVTYDLAYWTNERGDSEEAKRLYERCLALNPEHRQAKRRLGLIRLEETRRTGG